MLTVLVMNLFNWKFISCLRSFKFLKSFIPFLPPFVDLVPESRRLSVREDGFLRNTTKFALVQKCKLSQYERKIRKYIVGRECLENGKR